MAQDDKRVAFAGVTIPLRVSDVDKEVRFFVEKLGFSLLQCSALGDVAHVSRGTVIIHLAQFFQPPEKETTVRVIIHVTDVERLYEELRCRRLRVRKPLMSVDHYCLDVRTPSGYLIRFEDTKF